MIKMARSCEIDYDEIVRDNDADQAILIRVDEETTIWIPRSYIFEHDVERHTMTIPEWLALKEGLI